MSQGKSQAGRGKSNNKGVPEPSGTNTEKIALSMVEQERQVESAFDSLDDKGKVETEGSKVSFEDEPGSRTFEP